MRGSIDPRIHPKHRCLVHDGLPGHAGHDERETHGRRPLLDRLTIRQLVEDWAVLRDARMWDRFREVWHDDGRMMATWFQGTRDEFIKVSEEG